MLSKIVSNLPVNKAIDPSSISSSIITEFRGIFYKPFCNNILFTTWIFNNIFKPTNVKLIFEKDNKLDNNNCSSAFLLSNISKAVHTRLANFLKKHEILFS